MNVMNDLMIKSKTLLFNYNKIKKTYKTKDAHISARARGH